MEKRTGIIISPRLILRKEPTFGSKSICVLRKGNIVTILDDTAEGFYKVEFNKKIGYCVKDCMKEEQ